MMTTEITRPTVTVVVQLHGELGRLASTASVVMTSAERELARRATELVEELGIPCSIEVRLEATDDDVSVPLVLVVEDLDSGAPAEWLLRSHSLVTNTHVAPDRSLTDLIDEIGGGPDEWSAALASTIAMVGSANLGRRPALLLTNDVTTAYREMLAKHAARDSPDTADRVVDLHLLHTVLTGVLDMRISIADMSTVAAGLELFDGAHHPPLRVAEQLIARLRPSFVEVAISESYFRNITTSTSLDPPQVFTMLRDGLFYELGLRFPDIRFVFDEARAGASFSLRINHVSCVPWLGLRPGEVLVSDTAERLGLRNIEALAKENPATGRPYSIVSEEDALRLEEDGLTTWDALGYLVLCMAHDLRSGAHTLLDETSIAESVDDLAIAFPTLTGELAERFHLSTITQALRGQIREGLSIRDLRGVFEAMLDFDYIEADESQLMVFDDRIPRLDPPTEVDVQANDLIAFIRRASNRQISEQYTGGTSTLIVYLLDREVEDALRAAGDASRIGPGVRSSVVSAIQRELAALPPTSERPGILTTTDVRPIVRELIRDTCPRIPVLAYGELVASLNIQPIARIGPFDQG